MIVIIIVVLILVVPYLVFSFNFVPPQEEVRLSLGEYEVVEYCSYGVFQDFTDYGKFTYENPDLINNEYLSLMTDDDIKELNRYLDNYDEWVDVITEEITDDMTRKFSETYDFNRNIISNEDYCYIYSNPDYPEFSSYDIYFYDTETEILYYFHNNI